MLCVAASASWPAGARAQLDAGARTQESLVHDAQQAERGASPAEALALWRAARAAGPTSRLARRAEVRIAWLEARDEGGFAPLASLMRVQALRADALDRAGLEAFERELVTFPPGRVRREARAVVALSWLERLHDPARAKHAYEAWLREPGLEPDEHHVATVGLALARASGGDVRAGIATLERGGYGARTEATELRRRARQETGDLVALATLFAFVALALVLAGRELVRASVLRRAFAPARALTAVALLVAPGALAYAYDPVTLDTFALVAGGGLAVVALASVSAAALRERRAPRARALALAVGATLAALALGYLALGRAGILLSLS